MAPRAAATALRSLAAAATAAASRTSPAFSSLGRNTTSHTLTRVAATASAPPRAANHAFFSSAATSAANRSSAVPRISTRLFSIFAARFRPATGNKVTRHHQRSRLFSSYAARSPSAARYKVTRHPFKSQRRFQHQSAKTSIPDEVQSEIYRIEADGLKRHQHQQKTIQLLTKQVADCSVAAKKLKVDSTWTMGKTAFRMCSAVVAGAAFSGYLVLDFVKDGCNRTHQDPAWEMLVGELKKIKDDLDSRMNRIFEEKERMEAAESQEKNRVLDERESVIAARESAVAAREASVAAKEAAASGKRG